MKLIKFVRKAERDGARILYIPLTAEKISQLAVMESHTDKDGKEVPTLYFLDCYGLGTIELSEEQFNLVLNEMDGLITINEYNTEMTNGSSKETSSESETSKESSCEKESNSKDEEAKSLVDDSSSAATGGTVLNLV